MLFPFYIYSICVLGFCLGALELLDGQVKQGALTVWAFGPEMGAAPSTGLKSRQGAAAGEHFPQGL